MRKLIKTNSEICRSCRYHMGFGSQPDKEQKVCNNVACNYQEVTGHSRIFENGKIAYPPELCDKYEPGEKDTYFGNFIMPKRVDKEEYEKYKIHKVKRERKVQQNV